ncbi:hypothetical protein [Roseofilum casamattae]|uniref:Glycerate kinase n=1 Tax=Roseofilum casamattae BLCC-M143 TaxID=3022442 RepID=A0ABT7BYH6_9CYAN|nr:hypothetical protein [Roseofilum casamattae]MDJ1183559.1 glycerate kinase [Roseofilum casamattae BLCC-M143]
MDIDPILQNWMSGKLPTAADYDRLQQLALANCDRTIAFNRTSEILSIQIPEQARLFPTIAAQLPQLIPRAIPQIIYRTLWQVWFPLAWQIIADRQRLDRPLVQGILGSQGMGKTTLCRILSVICTKLSYSCASLSLDDLYKTYSDRQQLKEQDPRLSRRGPPGTHDIELGINALQDCRNSRYPVEFPRFDKSAYGGDGDRTTAESIEHADIIFFEGWFVGVRPIDSELFDRAPPPIATESDRQFAREMNQRLHDYLPLWDYLDRLIILYPTDYRLSKQWRKQAEQEAIARGNAGMSDGAIDEFVDYFWRTLHPELFITPLTQNSDIADLVIEINRDRSLGRIYCPHPS